MSNEVAIKIEGVSKDFSYSRRKSVTVKSAFTGALRRKTKDRKTVQHALKDINFEVKKGEFFGIVGRNGSGKSTLLKMLAGIYQPSSGKVSVHGKLVPFIELGVGFNPELTGRENVYMNGALLGFSENEVEKFYDEVVEFAELEQFMDKKLKNYSSGMQVRLAFSMAIRAKADILLIDEVLAVGDADFQHKCFSYFRQLKKQNTTVVFVSHDMSAVREYCNRVILVDKGKITASGTPNKIADEYTKLFISTTSGSGGSSSSLNRQGNGKATIQKLKKIPTIYDKTASPTIEFEVKANEDIDNLVVGFRCKNSADAPLLGTSTVVENINIQMLRKDKSKRFKFHLPNIFNNGSYLIDVVAQDADGEIFDWLIDALRFDVKTEKKTGYLVEVPIKTEVTDV